MLYDQLHPEDFIERMKSFSTDPDRQKEFLIKFKTFPDYSALQYIYDRDVIMIALSLINWNELRRDQKAMDFLKAQKFGPEIEGIIADYLSRENHAGDSANVCQ